VSYGVGHFRPAYRSSLLIALAAHGVFTLLVFLAPSLGLFPERQKAPEVMMVRLRGGGENRPGWVKPTTAPADDAPVPDNKPQAAAKPSPPVEKRVETPPPVKREEPKPVRSEPEKVAQQTAEADVTEAVSSRETTTASESTQESDPVESGEGIGAKPGPVGPGVGVTSDADFPGADLFLSRVETEVQRRFNFRGSGTGAVAEYHFFLSKEGALADLVLMKSSGIGSLDLAARSALLRAKFPPLPPGFPAERLGVTYRFHDDK